MFPQLSGELYQKAPVRAEAGGGVDSGSKSLATDRQDPIQWLLRFCGSISRAGVWRSSTGFKAPSGHVSMSIPIPHPNSSVIRGSHTAGSGPGCVLRVFQS